MGSQAVFVGLTQSVSRDRCSFTVQLSTISNFTRFTIPIHPLLCGILSHSLFQNLFDQHFFDGPSNKFIRSFFVCSLLEFGFQRFAWKARKEHPPKLFLLLSSCSFFLGSYFRLMITNKCVAFRAQLKHNRLRNLL
jgi:hypothetical protein